MRIRKDSVHGLNPVAEKNGQSRLRKASQAVRQGVTPLLLLSVSIGLGLLSGGMAHAKPLNLGPQNAPSSPPAMTSQSPSSVTGVPMPSGTGSTPTADMNAIDAMPTLRPAQAIPKTPPRQTTAHTATTSSQKQHMGKEKPVVHFPDGAMPAADETSRVGTTTPLKTDPKTALEIPPAPAAEQPAVMPSPTAMGADNASATSNASWNAASNTTESADAHIIPTAMSPMSDDVTPAEALRHYNRAAYYGQFNRMNEAIAEYQDAIKANPTFADAYVGLSTAYMRKNDWENVIVSAEKALNLQTAFLDSANLAQAQFNLGAAHCAADDFTKANAYYEQIRTAHSPLAERLWGFLVKTCKP